MCVSLKCISLDTAEKPAVTAWRIGSWGFYPQNLASYCWSFIPRPCRSTHTISSMPYLHVGQGLSLLLGEKSKAELGGAQYAGEEPLRDATGGRAGTRDPAQGTHSVC